MKKLIFTFLFLLAIPSAIWAQGNAFSFQGRLNDGTNPANGTYDLEFKLYSAINGGTQIGSTIARSNTALVNGVFSVMLDFGSAAFNDPNAVFIEVAVRPNGSPNAFTILGGRQQLTVVPYAVRSGSSANSDTLGGLGSTDFIKNSTTAQTGNFNINGSGVMNSLGATTGLFASNLGIGTVPPYDLALDVYGSGRFQTSQGTVNIGTPNGETGISILSPGNRADLRFDGIRLRLMAGPDNVPPVQGLEIFYPTGAVTIGSGYVTESGKLNVGTNRNEPAIFAQSTNRGVWGKGTGNNSIGAGGESDVGVGVKGESPTGIGVKGESPTGIGVLGQSTDSVGVLGQSNLIGVKGFSSNGVGTKGESTEGIGIEGRGRTGVSGYSPSNIGVYGQGGFWAGYFEGDVRATGYVYTTAVIESSDRNAKANFSTVDTGSVLRKVAGLPIQSWNFKNQPTSVRHMGTMAQDFHAAFGLGTDDKHIATLDANGVALASIQELYKLMLEKDKQITKLQSQVRNLQIAVKHRRPAKSIRKSSR